MEVVVLGFKCKSDSWPLNLLLLDVSGKVTAEKAAIGYWACDLNILWICTIITGVGALVKDQKNVYLSLIL